MNRWKLFVAFTLSAATLSGKTVLAGPYVDAVLADNPSGYWRLEEGTGTAFDSSSVGGTNNGTYVGAIDTMTGAVPAESPNLAYRSNNVGDYIRISDTFTDLAMSTSEYTLEHWLNPDLANSSAGNSLVRGYFFGQGAQFVQQNGTFISAGVDRGAGGTAVAPGIEANTWTHVVMTAQLDGSGGTDLTLYFNGVEAATHNTGISVAGDNSGEDFVIGTLPFGNPNEGQGFYDNLIQAFVGGIDEVAIYPYVLAPSRIQAHFDACCFAPPDPGKWIVNASGRWQDPNNWDSSDPPDSAAETAKFLDVILAPRTVVNELDVTINGVEFDSVHEYVIGGNGEINLQASTSNPNITVSSGSHKFTTEVNLLNATTIDVSSGSSVEFVNQLSLGGNSVTKTGAGTLLINNDSNAGAGTLTVEDGVLAGGGVVGGNVVISGGILAPGSVFTPAAAVAAQVPEPQTALLIAVGGLALGWSTRRAGIGRQKLFFALLLAGLFMQVVAGQVHAQTLTDYRNAVLADGPSGYWPLDETSGTIASDISPVGGTNNGSHDFPPITRPGFIAGSNAFDSLDASDFVRIDDTFTNAAMAATEFTMEHWLQPEADTVPTSQNSFVRGHLFNAGDPNCCWSHFIQQFGFDVVGGINAGIGGTVAADPPGYGDGDWVHIAMTAKSDGVGGTILTLYADGTPVNTTNSAVVPFDSSGESLQIGALANGNPGAGEDPYDSTTQGYNGGIDEVAYYDYALTQAQICGHVLAGGGSCTLPAPVGSWDVNGSGSWQASNNWAQNETPDDQDDIATLGNVLSAPASIWTDAPVTVNGIIFDNANEYVVAGNHPINLSASTALTDPTITVLSGDHQFQAEVNATADLTIDVANGSTLEFVNQFSMNGNTLTVTGGGTVVINDSFGGTGAALAVANGVFAGGGTIYGDVEISGGFLSPGSGTGSGASAGQVPEPGTGLLVLSALGLMGIRPRRM